MRPSRETTAGCTAPTPRVLRSAASTGARSRAVRRPPPSLRTMTEVGVSAPAGNPARMSWNAVADGDPGTLASAS